MSIIISVGVAEERGQVADSTPCLTKIMTAIASRLQAVAERIAQAARSAGVPPEGVRLVAVSKTFPARKVREAFCAGQRAFGESYVQEAVEKMAELYDLPLEWHFVGPIQSNKTRLIAERFDWVHSLDREKIARRLSEARPEERPPLKVLIQVNVSGEATKGGVRPEEVERLARYILSLPRLELKGLMAIPRPSRDFAEQRSQFRILRQLQETLRRHGIFLDTLSMGMSDDLEAALAEGATLVRVGAAIFGERKRDGR